MFKRKARIRFFSKKVRSMNLPAKVRTNRRYHYTTGLDLIQPRLYSKMPAQLRQLTTVVLAEIPEEETVQGLTPSEAVALYLEGRYNPNADPVNLYIYHRNPNAVKYDNAFERKEEIGYKGYARPRHKLNQMYIEKYIFDELDSELSGD